MATSKRFAVVWVCLPLLFLNGGCAHVTPVLDEPAVASFDGNDLNSGIVKQNVGKDGKPSSYEITGDARGRYNQWLAYYRKEYGVPADYGVTPMPNGNYDMTLQAAAYWHQMITQYQREKNDHKGTLLNKVGL